MYKNLYQDAFPELERLYAELDDALEKLHAVCDGCGGCCHFDRVDHVLYASALERAYLLTAPFPDTVAEPGLVAQGLRCPYQVDGGCGARRVRVLGCRLHFCRWPADAQAAEAEFCEEWHARLKRIHDTGGLEWRYGPLLPLETLR